MKFACYVLQLQDSAAHYCSLGAGEEATLQRQQLKATFGYIGHKEPKHSHHSETDGRCEKATMFKKGLK